MVYQNSFPDNCHLGFSVRCSDSSLFSQFACTSVLTCMTDPMWNASEPGLKIHRG